MVEIPTSRSISRVSPSSGRPFVAGPRTSIGDGLRQLGSGMQGAAFDLLDVADRTQKDARAKSAYDVSVEVERFRSAEEARLLEQMDKAPASGIGFTADFIGQYQKRANEFVENQFQGLDENTDAQYRRNLLSLGSSLYQKADLFESKAKTGYYTNTTNDSLDRLRKSIRNNGAPLEDLRAQGADIINAADMPEAWKAERLRAWDEDSAVSQWEWEFAQNPRQAVAELRGGTSAASIIRRFEGFRETPYWDVDAHRVGYGSDTITKADGSVVPVTKGMRVSREDAERDLARRIQEFEQQAVSDVGQDAWSVLPQNVRDALVSVTYNYGEIPARIRGEIRTGDPERIARAVEQLGSDNGGVNRKRRAEEAAIIRGEGGGGKYDAIPYERQQQLVAQGEEQIASDGVKAAASVMDRYQLAIATTPQQVTREQILSETSIDDGQKATLIKSLDAANKEGEVTRRAFASYSAGEQLNPFDSDDRKGVDGLFKEVTRDADEPTARAVAEEITRTTSIAPRQVVKAIRSGMESNSPAEVANAMQTGHRLLTASEKAFSGTDGGDGLVADVAAFRRLVDGLGFSPEQAAQRMIDARDKSGAPIDKKELNEFLKKLAPSDLESGFDESRLPFTAPSLGTASREAAIMADYRELAEGFYADTRDPEMAKAKALSQMKKLYAVSNYANEGRVMRYPPERYYPTIGGSFDYFGEQIKADLGEITGREVADGDYWVVAAPGTKTQVAAGAMPRYQVFYYEDVDGFRQIRTVPQEWAPDIDRARDDLRLKIEQEKLSGDAGSAGLESRYREAVDKNGETVIVDTYTKDVMERTKDGLEPSGRKYGRSVMVAPSGAIIPRRREKTPEEVKREEAAREEEAARQAESERNQREIDPYGAIDAQREEFRRRMKGGN